MHEITEDVFNSCFPSSLGDTMPDPVEEYYALHLHSNETVEIIRIRPFGRLNYRVSYRAKMTHFHSIFKIICV